MLLSTTVVATPDLWNSRYHAFIIDLAASFPVNDAIPDTASRFLSNSTVASQSFVDGSPSKGYFLPQMSFILLQLRGQ